MTTPEAEDGETQIFGGGEGLETSGALRGQLRARGDRRRRAPDGGGRDGLDGLVPGGARRSSAARSHPPVREPRIAFPGPPGTVPHISLADVESGDVQAGDGARQGRADRRQRRVRPHARRHLRHARGDGMAGPEIRRRRSPPRSRASRCATRPPGSTWVAIVVLALIPPLFALRWGAVRGAVRSGSSPWRCTSSSPSSRSTRARSSRSSRRSRPWCTIMCHAGSSPGPPGLVGPLLDSSSRRTAEHAHAPPAGAPAASLARCCSCPSRSSLAGHGERSNASTCPRSTPASASAAIRNRRRTSCSSRSTTYTFDQLEAQWPFTAALPRQGDRRAVKAAGARAIAYDVQFTEPSGGRPRRTRRQRADRRRASGPATSCSPRRRSAPDGTTRVLRGRRGAQGQPARCPPAGYSNDADGRIRHMLFDQDGLESLPLGRRASAQRGKHGQPRPAGDSAWIDFPGPPGTVARSQLQQRLRRQVPGVRRAREDRRGRLHRDRRCRTSTAPRPPATRLMAGAEIQADAIHTALDGFPLRQPRGG